MYKSFILFSRGDSCSLVDLDIYLTSLGSIDKIDIDSPDSNIQQKLQKTDRKIIDLRQNSKNSSTSPVKKSLCSKHKCTHALGQVDMPIEGHGSQEGVSPYASK